MGKFVIGFLIGLAGGAAAGWFGAGVVPPPKELQKISKDFQAKLEKMAETQMNSLSEHVKRELDRRIDEQMKSLDSYSKQRIDQTIEEEKKTLRSKQKR
ncbi:MAG: hypothetical protein HYT79_01955 [Elusimicrobia bacterium]|nr:hypothetical protein [Elusimicrobiota bacterium]